MARGKASHELFEIPDPTSLSDEERMRGRVKTLSVVIPAYNEQATIAHTLQRVLDVNYACKLEVIVVDDASTDGTREAILPFVERGVVTYARLASNSGKGSALRAGFALVSGDIVLVQDADDEYDPRDIPAVIEPILDGRVKVSYGSRVINEHCERRSTWLNPFWWGGRTLTALSNVLFRSCRVSDEPVCYKAIRTDFLRTIPLRCTGFEFCPELTAKVSRRGAKIWNTPIRYSPRSVSAGKKIRSRHWFEAVWTLILNRLMWDAGPVADFNPQSAELSELKRASEAEA